MIKKAINFLIFSHFWISIGAVSLLIGNYKTLNIEINYAYLSLAFFSTLFGYSLQYSSQEKINNLRLIQSMWVEKNKSFILVCKIVSLLASLFFAVILFDIKLLFLSIPFFLIVFLYKTKTTFLKGLRTFPFVKIFLIASCWAWVCSIIPQYLCCNINLNWVNVSYNFIFIIAITIPFDVRDLNYDLSNLLTIPTALGKRKSIFLAQFLIISLLIPCIFYGYYEIAFYLIFVFLVLIPAFFTKNEYYYLFMLDGVLVVFPIFAVW